MACVHQPRFYRTVSNAYLLFTKEPGGLEMIDLLTLVCVIAIAAFVNLCTYYLGFSLIWGGGKGYLPPVAVFFGIFVLLISFLLTLVSINVFGPLLS